MYGELLGYEDSQKKVFICDDDLKIKKEYTIGEMLVDFMELDFSSFSIFYDDIKKLYTKSSSTKYANNTTIKISLNKKNATHFFAKYPILREEIIKEMIEIRKRWYDTGFNYDIDYSIFDSYFNIAAQPAPPDCFELTEQLGDVEKAVDHELLIDRLVDDLNNVHDINEMTWKFIYNYQNPYISNLNTLLKHPYMQLVHDDMSDDSVVEHVFPHILQEQYREAFIFCFDVDFHPILKNLTAEKRLYLFNNLYPHNSIAFQDIKSEFVTKDMINDIEFTNEYKDLVAEEKCFFDWFNNHADSDLIKKVSNLNIHRFQLYETYNLRNIIAIEFQKMVEHNVKIKKCKHCGKYFILKGDYATEYCDRIVDGEKFTCKKIAAMHSRKVKIQNNPILKEFERAYKRNYARVTNKNMTNEQFRIWVDEATKRRDILSAEYETTPSDVLISEFKKYLGNK